MSIYIVVIVFCCCCGFKKKFSRLLVKALPLKPKQNVFILVFSLRGRGRGDLASKESKTVRQNIRTSLLLDWHNFMKG